MADRVAAVQAIPRWEETAEGMRARTSDLVERAVAQGAGLVALPGTLGWALAGAPLAIDRESTYGPGAIRRATSSDTELAAVCRDAGASALRVYQDVARAFGIWLITSAYPSVDDQDRLYQASAVLDETGQVVLQQRQTHRGEMDRLLGMARGERLAVAPTPLGAVGLIVGEDIRHPEVGRLLSLMGAELLIHPGAWPEQSPGAKRSRLWREAQSNLAYGLEAPLSGATYNGRAEIVAPCAVTGDGRGYIAAGESDDDEAVMARLDLERLRALRRGSPWEQRVCLRLVARDLPFLYREGSPS